MVKNKSFDFVLDESLDIPLWVQLKNRMAYLIEQGFYEPGEQLPTVRALASDLAINYNTVNKVYLSLAADGFIESSRGRGAFVLDVAHAGQGAYGSELDEALDDFIAHCTAMGLTFDDIGALVSRRLGKLKYDQEHAGEGHIINIDKARGGASRKAGGRA